MTPEQIRERCTQFVLEECKGRWPAISIMEYFYSEAMAAGLEMAREGIGRRIDHYSNTRWAGRPGVRDLQINEASGCQQVCETLASKLKEPPCDTSS